MEAYKRLLGCDPGELRSEYLWDFAKRLGMDGNQVDALRFHDFVTYIRVMRSEIEEEKKDRNRQKQGNSGGGYMV